VVTKAAIALPIRYRLNLLNNAQQCDQQAEFLAVLVILLHCILWSAVLACVPLLPAQRCILLGYVAN